jgi:hypothetical protein
VQDDPSLQLDSHERQSLNFEETLPPTAPAADQIDVQVEAQYPVE